MDEAKPTEGPCFRRLAGMERVFEPGGKGGRQGKKHPCPDCSFCQFCAETRCLTCRSGKDREGAAPCKKLSFREQILLYEKMNTEQEEAK